MYLYIYIYLYLYIYIWKEIYKYIYIYRFTNTHLYRLVYGNLLCLYTVSPSSWHGLWLFKSYFLVSIMFIHIIEILRRIQKMFRISSFFHHIPYLVGGLEHEWNIFTYIGNFIIPTDFHSIIFQRGRYTINQITIMKGLLGNMKKWSIRERRREDYQPIRMKCG